MQGISVRKLLDISSRRKYNIYALVGAESMIIYEEILRQFQKQKVRYVLVGGRAVKK
jgi:hypothetical protein